MQVPFDTVVLPSYRVTRATVMTSPHPNLKVILIGGSSQAGKSTLSESLAATLGWTRLSTDSLARHPGLPWRPAPEKVPKHVAEHYLCLSVDDLIDDVLRHYKVNVWSKVEAIIASRSNDPSTTGIVVEGSALWPEFRDKPRLPKDRRNMAHSHRGTLPAKNPRRKPIYLEIPSRTHHDRQVPRTHPRLQRTDGRSRQPPRLTPNRCHTVQRNGTHRKMPIDTRH